MKKEVDLSRYKGEWVVICENKVVAHSNDVNILRKAAEKCKTIPELRFVPKTRCEYPSLFRTIEK